MRIGLICLIVISFISCKEEGILDKDRDYLPSSWSSSEVISLCDSSPGKMAPNDLVFEHLDKQFYNKKVTKSEHEISVQFDFLSECCQSFDLNYKIKNHILLVEYFPTGESYKCECWCDYRGLINIGYPSNDYRDINFVRIGKRKVE